MMITMEEAQRRLEEDEGYRKIVKMISEGSNEDYGMQCFRAELHEKSGLDEDQIKVLECGIRWAVEARRKERGEEKRRQEQEEQLWQAEQGQTTEQEQGKQGKQVRFGEEQQLGKTEAEKRRRTRGDGLERQRYGQADDTRVSSQGGMTRAG